MTIKCEEILPYHSPKGEKGKSEQIRQMFDTIAGKYDPMNRIISLGNDRHWRKKALLSLKALNPKQLLDVATGTGDFAITACQLLSPEKITGIDLSEKMLEHARQKVEKLGLTGSISFETGDSMKLNFADQTFDAVTVAFGVRNFENLALGLSEIARVLKTGGKAVILELSEPQNAFLKWGYKRYTRWAIPFFARLFSKDTQAYHYLPQSIEGFPQEETMKNLLYKSGFSQVKIQKFTFGVCAFYLATKNNHSYLTS